LVSRVPPKRDPAFCLEESSVSDVRISMRVPAGTVTRFCAKATPCNFAEPLRKERPVTQKLDAQPKTIAKLVILAIVVLIGNVSFS
jgi:hypothetical protein